MRVLKIKEPRSRFQTYQIKTNAEKCVERAGGEKAWTEIIGPEMRSAIVEAQAWRMLYAQVDEATFHPADLGNLKQDLVEALGLDKEP